MHMYYTILYYTKSLVASAFQCSVLRACGCGFVHMYAFFITHAYTRNLSILDVFVTSCHRTPSAHTSPSSPPPHSSKDIPPLTLRPPPLPLIRIAPPPLPSPLLDRLLAQMAKPVPPPKTRPHQRIRIHQPSRNRLHDLEDLHRVAHGPDLRLADLEHRQRDAEERLRPLVEEGVPHPQRRLDGQRPDEARHEPRRAAQRDGRETHRRRRAAPLLRDGPRPVQLAPDLRPHPRHRLADAAHQHAEVDVGALEADLVRPRKVRLGDDVEHPEGALLVEEEQEEPSEEVERLAVPDLGVVDRGRLEHAAQGLKHGRLGFGFGADAGCAGVRAGREGDGVGLEEDVVRERAVEVALDELLVGSRDAAVRGAGHELGVQTGVLGEYGRAAGVPEPGLAAPVGRDALADEALRLGRLGGEHGRVFHVQPTFLHQADPFAAAPRDVVGVFGTPGFVVGEGDVLRFLFEAVAVAGVVEDRRWGLGLVAP